MNVTRDVVIDLLTLVLAGEASEDSKTLVESYLERDPELARIASARASRLSTEHAPEPLEKEVEMKTLQKTKKLLNWRSVMFAGAVLFSVFPVYFSGESRGPHWLPLESPVGAALSAALAVLFWAGVLWIRRSLRGKAT